MAGRIIPSPDDMELRQHYKDNNPSVGFELEMVYQSIMRNWDPGTKKANIPIQDHKDEVIKALESSGWHVEHNDEMSGALNA